jgi:tRNA G26 N,N-dimethylase Trm1
VLKLVYLCQACDKALLKMALTTKESPNLIVVSCQVCGPVHHAAVEDWRLTGDMIFSAEQEKLDSAEQAERRKGRADHGVFS